MVGGPCPPGPPVESPLTLILSTTLWIKLGLSHSWSNKQMAHAKFGQGLFEDDVAKISLVS